MFAEGKGRVHTSMKKTEFMSLTDSEG